MNIKNLFVIALAALSLAMVGCGSPEPAKTETPTVSKPDTSAKSVAYAEGSIKKGDTALCAVCVAKEGTTAEEAVAETINYNGKTYAFCNESEKAEFISTPEKYAAK